MAAHPLPAMETSDELAKRLRSLSTDPQGWIDAGWPDTRDDLEKARHVALRQAADLIDRQSAKIARLNGDYAGLRDIYLDALAKARAERDAAIDRIRETGRTREMNEHLRELALAATPGPWEVTTNLDYWVEKPHSEASAIDFNGIAHCGDIRWPGFQEHQKQWEANAAFIAAINPQAVLALLDEIDRLTARIGEVEGERDEASSRVADLEAVTERAEDIVALWQSPKIQDLARADRNKAIEEVRESLIQEVMRLRENHKGEVRKKRVAARYRDEYKARAETAEAAAASARERAQQAARDWMHRHDYGSSAQMLSDYIGLALSPKPAKEG